MDQQTQTKLATLAGGIRPHVVARARERIVAGYYAQPSVINTAMVGLARDIGVPLVAVPVLHTALAGDGEEAAREAFDSKLADRFE
jgi:hypothetical protein